MTTEQLIAEAGIRQLHARYADAVFRKDYAAFADCFTEDAEWHVGGHTLRGRADIISFIEDRTINSHWVLMNFHTPLLEVGNGMATGRTYVTEQNIYKNAPPRCTVATYFERFVEESGTWRRVWADFQLHYMGPADFSGEFFVQPDVGAPPALPPGR